MCRRKIQVGARPAIHPGKYWLSSWRTSSQRRARAGGGTANARRRFRKLPTPLLNARCRHRLSSIESPFRHVARRHVSLDRGQAALARIAVPAAARRAERDGVTLVDDVLLL